MEMITHSLCSLEYEDHRPLYDWFLDELEIFHPRQIEFARLNVNYTVLSKRKLIRLVKEGHVKGWDDPRMPTLSGMRRRGYPPEAVLDFINRVGIGKSENVADIALLEHCVRQTLNTSSPRVMGILNPLKIVIVNYPEDQEEEMDAANHPEDESMGIRKVPFSREIYIEQEDFREAPPPKYHRLSPGREIRLRYAYFIKCVDVVKDAEGNITEVHCTYDPATRGGDAPDGRKVKATIHWVSSRHALKSEIRLYDRLFVNEKPEDTEEGKDFLSNLNPDSLQVLANCYLEPGLANAKPGLRVQFERQGYFCVDLDSTEDCLVFNRTVPLRDTWAKISAQQG
ncbi:MAG TPA: glutamate--tRNA ligase family protein, partial [Anaerolineales bacterium]|nr:glutamate--tRNA ligase family protein [Anaerolineales bacterium]